jgi:hypothetical protein
MSPWRPPLRDHEVVEQLVGHAHAEKYAAMHSSARDSPAQTVKSAANPTAVPSTTMPRGQVPEGQELVMELRLRAHQDQRNQDPQKRRKVYSMVYMLLAQLTPLDHRPTAPMAKFLAGALR